MGCFGVAQRVPNRRARAPSTSSAQRVEGRKQNQGSMNLPGGPMTWTGGWFVQTLGLQLARSAASAATAMLAGELEPPSGDDWESDSVLVACTAITKGPGAKPKMIRWKTKHCLAWICQGPDIGAEATLIKRPWEFERRKTLTYNKVQGD